MTMIIHDNHNNNDTNTNNVAVANGEARRGGAARGAREQVEQGGSF